MHEIITVVVIPVALMGVIIAVFYTFFGRTSTTRDDPAGLRSFATFHAPKNLRTTTGDSAASDGTTRNSKPLALDDADQEEIAEALLDALTRELARRAIPLGLPERESYGYNAETRCGTTTFALRLGWIGEDDNASRDDDDAPIVAPLGWLLSVDPTRRRFSDSPDLRQVLGELHSSLKALSAQNLRWHRRQDWLAGRVSGNAQPLDRSLT